MMPRLVKNISNDRYSVVTKKTRDAVHYLNRPRLLTARRFVAIPARVRIETKRYPDISPTTSRECPTAMKTEPTKPNLRKKLTVTAMVSKPPFTAVGAHAAHIRHDSLIHSLNI